MLEQRLHNVLTPKTESREESVVGSTRITTAASTRARIAERGSPIYTYHCELNCSAYLSSTGYVPRDSATDIEQLLQYIYISYKATLSHLLIQDQSILYGMNNYN
ncbi:unnamed protein product [Acanthoscelides obtectus]|uniref:Uncharacterized protein n=1 Tax=Acanthoscelides obtectus TaxID=200917 RepID=A0A9P0PQK1_ACAOB|nr:unnamed protein product [Acanthoscelides obtectus]CAK1680593.1 hypothetical protein AOBTE_LOCUS32787 [Acanthoscelides obtectus]